MVKPIDKLCVYHALSNHQKAIQKIILKNTTNNQNGILKNYEVTQRRHKKKTGEQK